MPRETYNYGFKPTKMEPINLYGTSNKKNNGRRTLGIRDKQILYHRAKCKCEGCSRKIDFSEMQTGHKTAASKGGNATLRNSVCLCYKCNKLQGTDNWTTFVRKMGKTNTRSVTSGKKRDSSTKKPKKPSKNKNPKDILYGIPN